MPVMVSYLQLDTRTAHPWRLFEQATYTLTDGACSLWLFASIVAKFLSSYSASAGMINATMTTSPP
jgi:hypothetical protein